MKANKKSSVTKPLLKDLLASEQANPKFKIEKPAVESAPLDPPNLYQDSGQGYNSDLTFIQE